MVFKRIAIIGLGLLGGSFALAIKKNYPTTTIVAIGRSKEKLMPALDAGMVDEVSDNRIDGVAGADLIVIATPVTTIVPVLEEIAPFVEEGTLVTDFGSTKKSIVAAAEDIEMTNAMFVGCHPIAGGEQTGFDAAVPDLFAGRPVVITKTANTNENGVLALEALWKDLGAETIILSPEAHDMKLGVSSHLVHFAAVGLVSVLKQSGDMTSLYGTGFLDTTRIAQGDEKIWIDIVKTNYSDIINALEGYIDELSTLRDMIAAGSFDSLYTYLREIKEFRKGL